MSRTRATPLSPERVAEFYREVNAIRERRGVWHSPFTGRVGAFRDTLEQTQPIPADWMLRRKAG